MPVQRALSAQKGMQGLVLAMLDTTANSAFTNGRVQQALTRFTVHQASPSAHQYLQVK